MSGGSAPGAASGAGEPRAARPCSCEEAIERLFEYLDSEMPEADCLRVAAHLAICEGCHDAADAERHVRAILRRSCQQAAPESLRTRVIAQIIVSRARVVRTLSTE